VETAAWQSSYTIVGVKPGTYFVFTTTRPVQLAPYCKVTFYGAGFTKAVPCGLAVGCTDHTPIPVTVRAGHITTGIDPGDWYAPTNLFPAPPRSAVPDALWAAPKGGAFSTPLRAIEDFAPSDAKAYLTGATRFGCPANRVCLSLSPAPTGVRAAYAVGIVGSNTEVVSCVYLAYQDSAGWHAYRGPTCGPKANPFPVVGGAGSVFTGMGAPPTDCVNARAQPGLSGKILACLRGGTVFQIDGGPAWVAPRSPEVDGFWWHLNGRGWMLDSYLRPRF
jgi:hypothetical protein